MRVCVEMWSWVVVEDDIVMVLIGYEGEYRDLLDMKSVKLC